MAHYKKYNNYSKKRHRSNKSNSNGGCIAAFFGAIVSLFVGIIKLFVLLIKQIIRLFKKRDQTAPENTRHSNTDYKQAKKNQDTQPVSDSESETKKYTSKQMVSQCEINYMTVIREVLSEINPEYILTPQVNLTSIIQRSTKYANELFRNVDFGVFDKNYNVVVLIEINDRTHNQADRRERDHKVKAILEEANIPLITFWTKYGINREYIKEKLLEYCVATETSKPTSEEPIG